MACIVVIGAAVTIHQRNESSQRSTMRASVSNHAVADKLSSVQLGNLSPEPVQAAAQGTSRDIPGSRKAVGSAPVEMADARTSSPFADVVPGRAKDAVAGPGEAEQTVGGPSTNKNEMAAAASEAFIPDDLATENLAPRWTLSWDGVLQRSLDSGRTWQTIPVASHIIFRALAANGVDIWVGGKAGALFHSSDAGQRWTQVLAIADGQPFVADIVGVEFSDGQHGKLTGSNREVWITSDAGQSWQKQ
jgi:hypothetical protein